MDCSSEVSMVVNDGHHRVLQQIDSAFNGADNTLMTIKRLEASVGKGEADACRFYTQLGKTSWTELTEDDLEQILSAQDVAFYFSVYPFLFLFPAYLSKVVSQVAQGYEPYCECLFFVLAELEAVVLTLEEQRQKITTKFKKLSLEQVERDAHQYVDSGKEKWAALTGLQKEATLGALALLLDQFALNQLDYETDPDFERHLPAFRKDQAKLETIYNRLNLMPQKQA